MTRKEFCGMDETDGICEFFRSGEGMPMFREALLHELIFVRFGSFNACTFTSFVGQT